MKKLIAIACTISLIASLILPATGCTIDLTKTPGGNAPVVDQLYTTKEDNVTFYAFRYGNRLIETGHYYDIEYNLPGDIGDGDLVRITADVDWLSGGVAGFNNKPQIRKLIDFERIGMDELEWESVTDSDYGVMAIGDYADADYIYRARGLSAVMKGGKWLYKYDNEFVMDTGSVVCCREGITKDDIDMNNVCCADYFIIPPVERYER
ncbi:hypothetical protein SAMN02910456_01280 [Ruminococcaceae bacterium YRB3002]|nr:hypothetical protein SAMN02910456_01280 [Ruminococcaceae bacterium YRB3002]